MAICHTSVTDSISRSWGAWSTMVVEPTTQRTHPRIPKICNLFLNVKAHHHIWGAWVKSMSSNLAWHICILVLWKVILDMIHHLLFLYSIYDSSVLSGHLFYLNIMLVVTLPFILQPFCCMQHRSWQLCLYLYSTLYHNMARLTLWFTLVYVPL